MKNREAEYETQIQQANELLAEQANQAMTYDEYEDDDDDEYEEHEEEDEDEEYEDED